MKNNAKKLLNITLPILFWISVWQVTSMIINHNYFLPSVPATSIALWSILTSKNFLTVTSLSILRVIVGLILGILSGILLAVTSYYVSTVRMLLTPLVSIVKSTPIATIIILLWVMLGGDSLVIFIAILMVFPIIWQNLTDGFNSIDKDLLEVCYVYEFSFIKKMKILIFPTLTKYLIPAIITSAGLAWKAVISAEIIAYTKNSIGQFINDAKYNFDSATVFAWTFIVIVLSIVLEKLTKLLLRRVSK